MKLREFIRGRVRQLIEAARIDVTRDYYGILGIDRQATPAEIKAAYHRAAQLYHPDMHPEASYAQKKELTRKFVEVTDAYEVLGDPDLRLQYDRLRGGNSLRPQPRPEPEPVKAEPPTDWRKELTWYANHFHDIVNWHQGETFRGKSQKTYVDIFDEGKRLVKYLETAYPQYAGDLQLVHRELSLAIKHIVESLFTDRWSRHVQRAADALDRIVQAWRESRWSH